jgi:hypothetical protein
VQVPDDAVKITDDDLTISLKNVTVVDQFKFPGGAGNNLGAAGRPARVSFNITFTKSGAPRNVRPSSEDPLGAFSWAGEMSTATNSGTFSVSYDDRSFSASGSFSSGKNFGEMGTERNGSFVRREDRDEAQNETSEAETNLNAIQAQASDSPKFRGIHLASPGT